MEHRTVNRVTTILETVSSAPEGVPLYTLAEKLDAPKSSIFSLLNGLVSQGYLLKVDGKYTLGPAVSALLAAAPPPVLGERFKPLITALRAEFDETVMIATQVGDSIVYVAKEESRQSIRYSAPLGVRRPIYPTSTGKCFLAAMSDARQLRYLRTQIPSEKRRAEAVEELRQVRETGIAYNHGETLKDVSAAASLIGPAAKPTAAIAIAGPTVRVSAMLDEFGISARRAAKEAEKLLGL